MKQKIEVMIQPGFRDCYFRMEKAWVHENKFYVLSRLELPSDQPVESQEWVQDRISNDVETEYEVFHYLIAIPSLSAFKDLNFPSYYAPTIITDEASLKESLPEKARLIHSISGFRPVQHAFDDSDSLTESESSSAESSNSETEEDLSQSLGIEREEVQEPVVMAPAVAKTTQSCFSTRNLTLFAATTAIAGLAFIHQTFQAQHKSSF